MILYTIDGVKMPVFPRRKIALWIKTIAQRYEKKIGDVSYVFCSDEKILETNRTYLHHDYYTDIITFDYSANEVISGDLFISLDTVASNAEKFDARFEDELYRVMIHGVLHLCGIDDQSNEARMIMKQHEDEALRILYDTIPRSSLSL
jgi:rRNA maturation RNase YbeY